MAAEACLIPMVLGGKSEVLDFGLGKRLFTRAQKLAAIERDGGCATAGCVSTGSTTGGRRVMPKATTSFGTNRRTGRRTNRTF
ncbi:hypothetical protein JF66_18585 [Cryobacterium sp. MLB-32]|nr:hypothetical protein JF66_18585 [Cryobacterium sp. MLB-32]